MEQQIDRARLKDPREGSGWGIREGARSPQDYSDIARRSELNIEFERGGALSLRGRADGTVETRIGGPG